MRNLFLSTFRRLLSFGFNSKTSMIQAWKVAKLQGNTTITFKITETGEVVERQTTGVYNMYRAKNGKVIINFQQANSEFRSLRLENLV